MRCGRCCDVASCSLLVCRAQRSVTTGRVVIHPQAHSLACVQTDSQWLKQCLALKQSMVALMRERLLDELIEMDTWDWWKQQVFQLRSDKDYAEAEALFLEFKITTKS